MVEAPPLPLSLRGLARAAVTTSARRRLTWAAALLVAGRLAAWWLGATPAVARLSLADALTIAAAVVAGWPIVSKAWAEARRKTWGIPLLVSLAAAGALVIGEYWEAAAVTFLFGLGSELEKGTLRVARGAVTDLLRLTPEHATLVGPNDVAERVPLTRLVAGDVVLVRPGERVPVDGTVILGRTLVDERALTGESLPRTAETGMRVLAGSLAIDGAIRVRAASPAAESALAGIVRRVEGSQTQRAPAQRMVERFARVYTPAVALGSVAAFVVTRDMHLALTLLVIACPGALVIATPVAITAGLGRAARRGVLLRGGAALERIARIDTVAFDKTGTLTRGEPALREVVPFGDRVDFAARERVLRWAALAEVGSSHPLAQPILAAVGEEELAGAEKPRAFRQVAGRGVVASVAAVGEDREHEVLVGNAALLREHGVALGAGDEARVTELEARGRTAVLVAVDGDALGALGLADRLRDEARDLRPALARHGVRHMTMLTGDRRAPAAAVAAEAGVDEVHAELLPDEKLAAIERLRAAGRVVAMVGDGINDAPALQAADVGVAMGAAGTATALASSDVALLRDDLRALPEALGIARFTRAVLRQNLLIALVTVALLVAGVLAGALGMGGGMLVHQVSILAVLGNAARLARGGADAARTET